MVPEGERAADLEIAGGVEKEIGWLEIAMEDVSRVKGLECSQSLLWLFGQFCLKRNNGQT